MRPARPDHHRSGELDVGPDDVADADAVADDLDLIGPDDVGDLDDLEDVDVTDEEIVAEIGRGRG